MVDSATRSGIYVQEERRRSNRKETRNGSCRAPRNLNRLTAALILNTRAALTAAISTGARSSPEPQHPVLPEEQPNHAPWCLPGRSRHITSVFQLLCHLGLSLSRRCLGHLSFGGALSIVDLPDSLQFLRNTSTPIRVPLSFYWALLCPGFIYTRALIRDLRFHFVSLPPTPFTSSRNPPALSRWHWGFKPLRRGCCCIIP